MSEPITWTNERRKLSDLVPWEKNPKEIHEAEAARLIESLDEFGQIQTIAIGPQNEVYDGHQRKYVWAASARYGPDYEVDVRVSSRPLGEKERQKLVVFLHRGTVGTWDWEKLANEWDVSDLLEWGFDESELQLDWGDDEATEDPGVQVDKAQELQEKWGVARGDVWVIESVTTPGKYHRVMCGDNAEVEDVTALGATENSELLLSDPPYGIDWNTDYTRFTSGYHIQRRNSDKIAGDSKPFDPGPFLNFPCVILFGANFYADKLPIGTWLVWDKRHENGTALLSDAELGWMNKNAGVYIYSETWQGVVRSESIQHPTQKPSGLFRWCIEKSKTVGGVYDPFLGSGTTIVACEQTGRIGYGMEISPAYVSVSLERLAGMGLSPQLVAQ